MLHAKMEKEELIRVHEEVENEAIMGAKMVEEEQKRLHEEVENEAITGAKMVEEEQKRVREEVEKDGVKMVEQKQKRVQEEWEEEVEEAALLVRKSKPGKNSAINGSSSNGDVEDGENKKGGLIVNGSTVAVTENGGGGDGTVVLEEQPKEGAVEPPTALRSDGQQQRSQNFVYYDKDEGIWKCRFCCWTYETGNICFDHIQNAQGHLHWVMNGKTFNQPGTCFNFETKGGNFISILSGDKPTAKIPALEGLNVTSHGISVEKTPSSANNNQYHEHFKEETLPTSSLLLSEFSHDDHHASHKSSSIKETESADANVIDESDLDVPEIDVEKVLQKQNTHDLYCPNCNSCITRRVILRKRKRRVRTLTEDVKRNKPETKVEDIVPAKVPARSLQAISDQGHDTSNIQGASSSVPAANNDDHEREADIFRCLSCFSFFIPTGDGFKLFQPFGRKDARPTTQVEQISETKRSWFASIFSLNDGKRPAEEGSTIKADKEENKQHKLMPSSNMSNDNGHSSSTMASVSSVEISKGLLDTGTSKSQESAVNGNVTTNSDDISHDFSQFVQGGDAMDEIKVDNGEELKISSPFSQLSPNIRRNEAVPVTAGGASVTNGEYAANTLPAARQDGLKILISSDITPPILDKSQADQIFDMETQKKTQDDEAMSKIQVSNDKSYTLVDIPQDDEQLNKTMLFTDRVVEDTSTLFKVSHKDKIVYGIADMNAGSSPLGGFLLCISNCDGIYADQSLNTISKPEAEFQTGELLKVNEVAAANIPSRRITSKDTVVPVEPGPVETEPSQRVESEIIAAEAGASLLTAQTSAVEPRGIGAEENYRIEIIKSIVYGGLVESITSLSVVSSAAGGGAATLNTVALGLANLIGGIFIICHNLWQLKNDQEEQAINQVTERLDQYQELLGRRKNFVLHAIVAMLSYIIFGLLPPIIYAFSFRISDDRELKLVVAGAASFLCILTLATAKAYVQRPPKSYLGTVLRYIVLGFMVSGIAYVAGEFLNRLLEKLGLFESSSSSSSVPTLSLPEMTPTNQAWRASF